MAHRASIVYIGNGTECWWLLCTQAMVHREVATTVYTGDGTQRGGDYCAHGYWFLLVTVEYIYDGRQGAGDR